MKVVAQLAESRMHIRMIHNCSWREPQAGLRAADRPSSVPRQRSAVTLAVDSGASRTRTAFEMPFT